MPFAQPEEEFLEVAPRHWGFLVLIQCPSERLGSAAAGVPLERSLDLLQVEQPQSLGFLDCRREGLASNDGSEVEKRAGEGRDGDAVPEGDFFDRKRGAV